jgi:hypothetical protein
MIPFGKTGRAARVHHVEQVILADRDRFAAIGSVREPRRRVIGIVGSRAVDHQHAVRRQPGQFVANLIEQRRHRAAA